MIEVTYIKKSGDEKLMKELIHTVNAFRYVVFDV